MGQQPLRSCISNLCINLSFQRPECKFTSRVCGVSGPSCSRHVERQAPCGAPMPERQCGPIQKAGEERFMDFTMSDRQKDWLGRVQAFMTKHVRPAVPIYKQQDAEGARWKVIPVLEDLKKKARAEGPGNMFMPQNSHEDDEVR